MKDKKYFLERGYRFLETGKSIIFGENAKAENLRKREANLRKREAKKKNKFG